MVSALSNDRSYLSYLECTGTGRQYPADRFYGLSDDGCPLLIRYDLKKIAEQIQRSQFDACATGGFWKYRCLLPVTHRENITSLGEIATPLVPLNKLSKKTGAATGRVFLKDEGYLPTGSFKARGLSVVVSVAKEFGIQHLVVPTAGNAGEALAAYASQAGIKATIICPRDAPGATVRQIAQYQQRLHLVDGLINDCAKLIPGRRPGAQWREISTFKEPYRVEGKKTIAFEIAAQLNWQPPDYIFYPTGGGVGLVGIWKGFQELLDLGWIDGALPRMIAVQPEGCSPIVDAWASNSDFAMPVDQVKTAIHGMRVPAPFADRLMLKTLRASGGFGVTVADDAATDALRMVAHLEGQLLSLEGAAVVAAFAKALDSGSIDANARVVLMNSASGQKNDFKDEHNMAVAGSMIDIQ